MKLGKDAKLDFKPLFGSFMRLQRKMKSDSNIYEMMMDSLMSPPKYKVRLANFFHIPVIGLTDPTYYRQVLINHEKYIKYDTFNYDGFVKEGLLFTVGTRWAQQRQILGHVFKAEQLKDRIPMINQVAKHFLSNIEDDDIVKLFRCLIGQVVIKSFFSEDLSEVQLNGKALELEIVSLINDIAVRKFSFVRNFYQVFIKKEWRKYFQSEKERKLEERLTNLKAVAQNAIEKRLVLDNSNKQIKDFLDIYCDAYRKQNLQVEITFNEIIDQFITLFSAGTDSTSLLIVHCLYYLAKYPQDYQELVEEVQEIIGEDDVKYEQLSQLKKLQAFINETLRLRNPVLKPTARIVKEDHFIGDIYAKKGFMIIIESYYPYWSIENISNPECFEYKRWLSDKLVNKIDPFAFIPFSAGGRNCIGQHMAMIETKIILCHVLRMFTITIREDVQIGWIIRFLGQITPNNAIILSRK